MSRVLGESGAVRRAEAGQGTGFGWRIGAGALVAGQTMLFGLAAVIFVFDIIWRTVLGALGIVGPGGG